jgi:hypothetical protein
VNGLPGGLSDLSGRPLVAAPDLTVEAVLPEPETYFFGVLGIQRERGERRTAELDASSAWVAGGSGRACRECCLGYRNW